MWILQLSMADDATEKCHRPGRHPPQGSILPASPVALTNRGGSPCQLRLAAASSTPTAGDPLARERRRPQKTGFKTKTEARRWFADNVEPRLRTGAPSARDHLRRVLRRLPRAARRDRLAARRRRRSRSGSPRPRAVFGDVDAARARGRRRRRRRVAGRPLRHVALPADVGAPAGARRRRPLALHRPQPGRRGRPQPAATLRGAAAVRRREQIDALAAELGPRYGPLVVFAAETGLRPEEWIALERRDVDRAGRAVAVQRSSPTASRPRTRRRARSRRRVPADRRGRSPRSTRCRRGSTRRCSSPLRRAGTSVSTPGGRASGTRRSTPPGSRSAARTACATRSRPRRSRPAISTFELARLMGTSIAMIDRTYGHLARDSEEAIRARLDARARTFWRLSGVGRRRRARDREAANPRLYRRFAAMERTGIEPVTSGLQSRRSPS